MVSGVIEVSDPHLLYAYGAIIEPVVPFTHKLSPLQHGYFFVITGVAQSSAKLFTINFNFNRRPQYEVTDIALHMKTMFERHHVVRNSHVGGAWGTEELEGGLPIIAGAPFECCILVHDQQIKIAFNGAHFTSFAHRMPYDSINELVIQGDVKLSSVYIKPGPTDKPIARLPAMPALQKPPDPDSKECESFVMLPGGYHLHMPYSVLIPGGLHPGRVIFLTGVPNATSERFTVNLCLDQALDADIALHFAARFEEGVIVRNSRRKGKWEKEEREAPPFPFKKGKHFDMCIWVTEKLLLISVGSQHIASFKHRYPVLQAINTLQVTGDVKLNHVRMR